MSRRKLLQVSILWGEPPLPFKYRFFVRPLRGRMERGNQGTPLKPRQGPCPWTPLLKNLYLKGHLCTPGRRLGPLHSFYRFMSGCWEEGARGKVNRMWVPCPTVLSAEMVPP